MHAESLYPSRPTDRLQHIFMQCACLGFSCKEAYASCWPARDDQHVNHGGERERWAHLTQTTRPEGRAGTREARTHCAWMTPHARTPSTWKRSAWSSSPRRSRSRGATWSALLISGVGFALRDNAPCRGDTTSVARIHGRSKATIRRWRWRVRASASFYRGGRPCGRSRRANVRRRRHLSRASRWRLLQMSTSAIAHASKMRQKSARGCGGMLRCCAPATRAEHAYGNALAMYVYRPRG